LQLAIIAFFKKKKKKKIIDFLYSSNMKSKSGEREIWEKKKHHNVLWAGGMRWSARIRRWVGFKVHWRYETTVLGPFDFVFILLIYLKPIKGPCIGQNYIVGYWG
jgi:hypothetical protein